MSRPARGRLWAGVGLALVAACRTRGPLPEGWPPPCSEPLPTEEETVTWHEHVAPILEGRCVACHGPTGLAGPRLDTYQASLAPAIRRVVSAGGMPPWPAGGCCGTYAHAAGLDPGEVALLGAWDGSEGSPDRARVPLPTAPPLSQGTGEIAEIGLPDWEPSFEPSTLDSRCFLLDWSPPTDTVATGLDALAGNRLDSLLSLEILVVPPEEQERFGALDAASTGVGWACPQGLADDIQYLLGTWSPHFKACNFPEGVGIGIAVDSRLVIRAAFRKPLGTPDERVSSPPTLRLKLDDPETVTSEAIRVPFTNPLWLIQGGLVIRAGDADAIAWFQGNPAYLVTQGKPTWIHAVAIAMGEHASRATLSVIDTDGKRTCLLNLDPWDPRMPLQYYLQSPIQVGAEDQLHLECHWQNDATGARELGWGDESCFAMLLVTP
jgi:hypothetical protein